MKPESGVLDRIELSFEILKKGFLYLFLPFFLYKIIALFVIVLIGVIFFSGGFELLLNNNQIDLFTYLSSPKIVLIILVGLLIGLAYLLFIIPIIIYNFKTIKDIYEGKDKIDFKYNLKYGWNNFFTIMKTYWYIFAYVALIPSLLFIFGGLLFNISYFYGLGGEVENIGKFLMIFSGILFIIFFIYRGYKSKFALSSAIDNDQYTKNNFYDSINITKNKWFRIFGNFLLLGIIISLLKGLISGIIGSSIFSNFSFSGNELNQEVIKELINTFLQNFSIIKYIFDSSFNSAISTIIVIFTTVFTYVFYKRLKFEDSSIEKSDLKNEEKNHEKIIEL